MLHTLKTVAHLKLCCTPKIMLHTLYIVAHLTYCCTPYILLHTLNIVAHINFNQNGGHIKTLQVVTPVFSSSNVYRFSTPIQESGGLNLQFAQYGHIMRHCAISTHTIRAELGRKLVTDCKM